jgi:hypothetical protein
MSSTEEAAPTNGVNGQVPVDPPDESTSLVVRRELLVDSNSFKALVASKHYTPTLKGMLFEVNEKGELAKIPLEDMRALVKSLVAYDQGWTWWLGDTGAAILALYGDKELERFCLAVNKDEVYVRKMISISKKFGFPDKLAERRHPDLEVTHAHHIQVMGIKLPEQQMKLLNECSAAKMNVREFADHVRNFKRGVDNTPDEGDGKPKGLGVFNPRPFRIYDPEKDNMEQFLQEYLNRMKEEDFPEYLDPALAAKRVEKETREKLASKLPVHVKEKVLAEQSELPMEEYTVLVNGLIAKYANRDKIKNYIGVIRDPETKREVEEKYKELGEDVPFEKMNAEGKKIKDARKQWKREQESITKLVAQIADPEKRSDILEQIKKDKLSLAMVKDIVQPMLDEQAVDQTAETLRDPVQSTVKTLANRVRTTATSADPKLAKPTGKKK